MIELKSLKLLCIIISFLLIPVASYSKPTPDRTTIIAKTAKLQIPFIENKGQVKDKGVRFYANTFAGNVYVTEKGEIVYGLQKREDRSQNTEDRGKKSEVATGFSLREGKSEEEIGNRQKGVNLRESLVGAKISKPQGIDRAETKVNYFIGNDKS